MSSARLANFAGLSGLKKAVDDAKKGAGAPQAEAPGYKPGTLLASMGAPAPEALAPAPTQKAVAAPPPAVPPPPKANGHSVEEEEAAPAPAGKPKSHGKRSKSEVEEKEESVSGSEEEESSSSGSESSGSSSSEEEEAKPSKASEKSSKKKPSPSRKAAPKESKESKKDSKDSKKKGEAKKVRIEEPKKAAAVPLRLPSLSDPMPSTAKQVRDLEVWFAGRKPLSIESIQAMNALDKSLQGLTINLEEKGFTCQWRMDCSPDAIKERAKALHEILKVNKDKDQATILGKYLAVLGSDKRKNFDIWHKTDTDHVIMATDYRFDEAMLKPELASVDDAHLKVRFYLSKGVLKQAFGIKARSKGWRSDPSYTRNLWNEKTLAEDAGTGSVPKWIPDTLFYNTSVRGEGAEAPEDGTQVTPPAPEERAAPPQKSSKRQRTAEAEEKQKTAASTSFLDAEVERVSNRSATPMEGVINTFMVELHATRLAVDTLTSEVMKLARELRK